MREVFVILVVIGVLLAFTAIKYRRQIVTLIGFYKQVQAIRSGLKNPPRESTAKIPMEGIQLIKCDSCGKWVSENQSVWNGSQTLCMENCRIEARV